MQQFMDGSAFIDLLLRCRPAATAAAAEEKETDGSLSSTDNSSAAVAHSVSEALITCHQRWSLVQALCLALARIAWDDTRSWRDEERRRRADELAAPQPVTSASTLRVTHLSKDHLPLSSFTFVSAPPVPLLEPKDEKAVSVSAFALLTALSSSLSSSLAPPVHPHLLLVEQGAFLGLLMDFSPASTSAISATLAPALLLPSAVLISLLGDYAESVRGLSSEPSGAELLKKTAVARPSLSLVSAAFAVKSLVEVVLPLASLFPSVPAASLLPPFTPSSVGSTPELGAPSLPSAAFAAVFSVFCATLGLRQSSLSAQVIVSEAALPFAPPSSLGKAVFASARHLSSLFEAAAPWLGAGAASSATAWSKATAVYEQPEQYKEEVWNHRTQTVVAMTRLVQRSPSALLSSVPSSPTEAAPIVLALLLVHAFLYELDRQLTVPLAHAYIDCIHALHALAPSASPSPSLRLTLALLPSLQPSSSLLGTDHRLARKVYRHVFGSLEGDVDGRRRAVELMKDMLDAMRKEEKEREKERSQRSTAPVDRPWVRRLRSRGRRSVRSNGADGDDDGGDAAEYSDDSDFDDARERRQQRFLARFSRSAMVEVEKQKDEDRRDQLEIKEKRVRRELLLAITRFCSAQLTTMRRAAQKRPSDDAASTNADQRTPPVVEQLADSVHRRVALPGARSRAARDPDSPVSAVVSARSLLRAAAATYGRQSVSAAPLPARLSSSRLRTLLSTAHAASARAAVFALGGQRR